MLLVLVMLVLVLVLIMAVCTRKPGLGLMLSSRKPKCVACIIIVHTNSDSKCVLNLKRGWRK